MHICACLYFFGPPCVTSPTSSFGLIWPLHFSCHFSTASYDPSTSRVTSPLPHMTPPLLMSILHCLIRPLHFSCDFSTASYDPSTSHVNFTLPHTTPPLLMSLLHCLIYPRCTPHPGGPPQLLLQRPVASASPSREAPSSATADVPYDSWRTCSLGKVSRSSGGKEVGSRSTKRRCVRTYVCT